jgi:pilus assembly protein CpaB
VLIAFLMAALLAAGVTFFFSKKLNARRASRATTQIVASTGELPSGITLAAKDVTLIDWPSDVPLNGSFSKAEEVIGRPLLYALGAKEPVLKRNLGLEGAGIGLAGRIPPGMRATAVRSNEIVGVAGFLYPGSHVDVLVTYTPPENHVPITQTVLQDVEVLTAGQTTEPDPQGKPQTVNVVTLLVNPEDSQKLQLASSQGGIQFVLRSGVDQKKNVELRPTRLDQLSGVEKPATPPPVRRVAKHVQPSAPSMYVLEVIQGTKRSVEKF